MLRARSKACDSSVRPQRLEEGTAVKTKTVFGEQGEGGVRCTEGKPARIPCTPELVQEASDLRTGIPTYGVTAWKEGKINPEMMNFREVE